jgi:hypothetical protein
MSKQKRTYVITNKGTTHRGPGRNESGETVQVVYGANPGQRNEIELTDAGAEALKHMGLQRKGSEKPYEVKGPAKQEDDGLDAMKVEDLKALAELNNVKLEKSDNRKDEIIAKLRTANVKAA